MRVAIIGGGQLARMLAHSGIPLGIEFSFLLSQSESDSCVKDLGKCIRYTPEPSYKELYELLQKPDVITIESENIDIDLLEGLNAFCQIHPNIESIRKLKNRFSEKTLLSQNQIATAKFFVFFSYEEFIENLPTLNMPVVIKACTGGYDGKRQYILKTEEDIQNFKNSLSVDDCLPDGYIAEEFIHFSRELSFIGLRTASGEVRFYPPAENIHENSILLKSIAPARDVTDEQIMQGRSYLSKLLQELDYVGVLAMECFETENKELLVNELAPRVHNSGHWTQAGCICSQFENHLRAILDLKAGPTESRSLVGMLNILGKGPININQLQDGASLNWYNKEKRENRKMGHINLIESSYESLYKNIDSLHQQIQNTA